jgi:hypothetical protein
LAPRVRPNAAAEAPVVRTATRGAIRLCDPARQGAGCRASQPQIGRASCRERVY